MWESALLGQRDKLAERTRALRLEWGWSLEELAKKSDVSRATLSRIENAEVSPTTEVLGKICAAYEMTLSRLLAPLESRFEPLIPHGAQAVWRDDAVGFVRRVVSPPSADLRSEVIRCDLGPNSQIAYDTAPVPGQEHHLIMLDGRLDVTVENRGFALGAGDCLRYQLHGASCFKTGNEPASYFLCLS